MGEYVKDKKKMRFQSVDALQQVVNVVNDASEALNDPMRTIRESAIPEVIAGALGAGAGGVGSFALLYGLGTVGLSAAGIASGLATAGGAVSAVIGGALSPMVAGVFVLASPAVVLAGAGVGVAAHLKAKQLKQEKERLYQEVLRRHNAIIMELEKKLEMGEERRKYLEGLNILLTRALDDLKHDLGYAA